MPLTGPDNPLLCHCFCYYLKWVYDSEMFTTGNTLSCSYGGLGKKSMTYIRSEQKEDEAYGCFIRFPVSEHRLGLLYIVISIPIHGGQDSNELRLQPLNPIHLLRNLYAGQESIVRTGHGTTDWFHTGKEVHQGCILSPCLFNLYAEYIMRNTGLEEAQAGIKIARRDINNLRYADDTTLMAESEEELKSLLMKVKESENWLKAQHSEN